MYRAKPLQPLTRQSKTSIVNCICSPEGTTI